MEHALYHSLVAVKTRLRIFFSSLDPNTRANSTIVSFDHLGMAFWFSTGQHARTFWNLAWVIYPGCSYQDQWRVFLGTTSHPNKQTNNIVGCYGAFLSVSANLLSWMSDGTCANDTYKKNATNLIMIRRLWQFFPLLIMYLDINN